MSSDLQVTLDFLRDLAQHNTRPWFEANRARYRQAHAAFEALVAELITEIGQVEDLGALSPQDCIYRIHRDVRFSKDKTPYKIHLGAVIGKGGRRAPDRGVYLHVTPNDGSFIAGGLYEPSREQLDHVRQHIAQDAEPLRAILTAPAFVRWFRTMEGDALKTAPQGYDRQHPALDLLRYKQYLVTHPLTDADVVNAGLVQRVVGAHQAMQPFLDYLLESATAPPSRWHS